MIFFPSRSISPSSFLYSPVITLIKVDLPAPFSPISPCISPLFKEKLTEELGVTTPVNERVSATELGNVMIQNGIIVIHVEQTVQNIENDIEQDFNQFEKYLRDISKNVADEKRYIEYPNPSFDVIKKFLRDYVKWNFGEEAASAAGSFPDPTYEIVNGTYVIHYKIFVNEQPSGLPLDHVSTFNNSLKFWQQQGFTVNEQPAVVEFSYTNLKSNANVWVTWVVRDLGEGVLGHAHLGKGVVEVALGDYECDGSFQLYDVESVEKIMTHELGHSVGLQHSSDQSNIMYPTLNPKYAYCLFS